MALNTNDIKKLEEYFVNYEELKIKKELRKFELLHRETDVNSGIKSKGVRKSKVEHEVITLNQDKRYNNLTNIINAVETVYKTGEEVDKIIIDCRYWKKDITAYEWEDIAYLLTTKREDNKIISKNSTLHARNRLLERFADLIGWVV